MTGAVGAALVAGGTAWAAWAQTPAAARDLSAYKEEAVAGGPLLLAAYLLAWGMLGAVVVRGVLKQRQLEQEVAALERQLHASSAGDTP